MVKVRAGLLVLRRPWRNDGRGRMICFRPDRHSAKDAPLSGICGTEKADTSWPFSRKNRTSHVWRISPPSTANESILDKDLPLPFSSQFIQEIFTGDKTGTGRIASASIPVKTKKDRPFLGGRELDGINR